MNTLPLDQVTVNERFTHLAQRDRLLPIKITPFYQSKIDMEVSVLGHCSGPLHRVSYPSEERLSLSAPGEVADFVDDRHNMPPGLERFAIRKYGNRMLFFPTTRCIGHCQYCFRQDVLAEEAHKEAVSLEIALPRLSDYLNDHQEIEEVILSGGDPMALNARTLQNVLERISSVRKELSIRIHTRAVAFSPSVFTKEKCDVLGEHKVRLVGHIIHPYEICDTVEVAYRKLIAAGVRVYNQFPLLRGINDHSTVLNLLLKRLDDNGIRNLSIFLPDAIYYSASFRVSFSRIERIANELNWSTSSWVNSTRFVLDSPIGKVRREDFVEYDAANRLVIFEREGQRVAYPDLPEEMDIPGDIETMLWQRRMPANNSQSIITEKRDFLAQS